MVVSAVIIVGYTSLGGFNAASFTDFIQSIIMTVALIIVVIFGISKAGGIDAVVNNAKALDGYLNMFTSYSRTAVTETGTSAPYSILTIVSTLAWGLGYFGMPHILLRFMAIENPNKIKTSRRVATVWVVISMAIAVIIGIVGNALMNGGVISSVAADGTPADKETIIILVAKFLAEHGIVPALVAGVILAGILASTMSTSDSQLLAASSSVSENILGGLFKLNLSETAKMIVARVTLIVIALIGIVVAWDQNSSVFKIVSFAWAGFGAAFGPVMLLSLFWRRSNKYGAIAGVFAGGAMVFIWKFVISGLAPILGVYELLPAFLTGLVVNVVVSLLTPKPEKEITDAFDAIKKIK